MFETIHLGAVSLGQDGELQACVKYMLLMGKYRKLSITKTIGGFSYQMSVSFFDKQLVKKNTITDLVAGV